MNDTAAATPLVTLEPSAAESPASGPIDLSRLESHFVKDRALKQQLVDALKARSIESSEFAKAFAGAQADFKPVKRVKQVEVRMKSGGVYTFSYAPLDVILEATLPALNKHGFSLTQKIGKGEHGDYIETTLLHETGERTNRTPIFVTDSGAQAYASGVTYARRYGVTLLLCVAAEDDDDSNLADGNDVKSAAATKAKGKAKSESQVVLEPGEQRRTAPTTPAFPVPRRAGPDPDSQIEAPKEEAEQVRCEGLIADAIQEFHEAALEGRRVGIKQIWSEIRSNEYVATQTWQRLKEQHPDSFATVSEVLKPKDKTPRGPKK